jgi:hypothetical protein
MIATSYRFVAERAWVGARTGMARSASERRPGVAAVWALVVLAAVSAISAAAVGQFSVARRQVDMHRKQIQADWLARSGYELAVARLLADPKGLADETVMLIPKGEVKITVRTVPKNDSAFRIESQAHYPVGERGVVVRTIQRTVKRVEGPKGIRVEPAGEP